MSNRLRGGNEWDIIGEKEVRYMELEDLTLDELYEVREQILADIADLDEKMPFDEGCDAFNRWAEEHEDMEDLLDDVVDRIEELGGKLP